MKSELKELAQKIKTTKPQYREAQSVYDKSAIPSTDRYGHSYQKKDDALGTAAWKLSSDLGHIRYEFRHRHIAYCLLRGRKMEQIENTKRCSNEKGHCYTCNHPDMKYVDKLMKEAQDETLCNSEIGPIEVAASSTSGTCSSGVVFEQPLASDKPMEQNVSISESEKLGLLDRVKAIFR